MLRENPRRGRGRGLEGFEGKEAERRGGAMKLWFGRNNEFAIKRFFQKKKQKNHDSDKVWFIAAGGDEQWARF